MKAKWIAWSLSTVIALLSCTLTATAKSRDKADRQFESISRLLEKADEAREKGDDTEAGRLYGASIAAYKEFHRKFPDAWIELTQFRMAYCRNQLMGLLAAKRAEEIGATAAETPVAPPPPPLPPEIAKPVAEGIELCRTGRYDEAEEQMQALVETATNCSPAYLVLATACVGKGDLAAAETFTRQAIELNPKSKEAHYNLCQLLIRSEDPDFDAARSHYQQAIRLGAEPDADLKAVLGLD
ncbi:MAG: hypothetical protein HN341_13905 [Verrucomicrobia bacterium]|jgi:tetratricopeptide (TPR) repeat protein|nr:hypothetical protein [Verrucomicrobiota bacterium]